jgi:hypothetical protein
MANSSENEMKKMLTILALSLACTGALAQMAQQLQTRFASANSTQDGKLTRQQAAAGMPMVARYFDQIDTAKAGYVTLPQIEAFMQQRAAAH